MYVLILFLLLNHFADNCACLSRKKDKAIPLNQDLASRTKIVKVVHFGLPPSCPMEFLGEEVQCARTELSPPFTPEVHLPCPSILGR